ncbi:hypothetical protein HPB47_024473 [Ixodes persulcatus]|uniref:Uncharacterized protein n=1 Tax=Ixodes persulcatus TaxID=34615 RepID=A0AC60Q6I5_IXOPE|nr:hypothetical protein HPB47_024473 [Ixodes persulcatus]
MRGDESVQRTVRHCTLDVHPSEPALVVRYELDAAVQDPLGDPLLERSRECRRTVRLRGLDDATDLASLAREVVARCDLLDDSKTAQVEQLLAYLRRRGGSGEPRRTPSSGRTPSGETASMARLEAYVEMLYEGAEDKVRASGLLLQLARRPENLAALSANDALLCALARVLREDGRRNTPLATNLAYVFFCFSAFSQFHPLLAEHKLGSLCMDLVEHELRRHAHWRHELQAARAEGEAGPQDRDWRKYHGLARRQEQLLRVCLFLLLNVAEEPRSEIKMVNRGLVPMLVDCLEREQTDLLLLALCFLKKLSVYSENVAEMGRLPTVARLAPLLGREPLAPTTVRLLLNLSFDTELRAAVLREGLLPRLVQRLHRAGGDAGPALGVLYHLSLDDRGKSHFAYTDCVPWLVRALLAEEGPRAEALALAVSLAANRRCAQLFCEGLGALVDRALDGGDAQLLRLLRTVSQHEGPTRRAFAPHLDALVRALVRPGAPWDLVLECAGTLANLELLGAPLERHGVLPWLGRRLGDPQCPPRASLALVALLGSAARADEACALGALREGLVAPLVALLRARQEDDDLVLEVAYAFDALLWHPSTRGPLVAAQEVPGYLLDLLHDRSPEVRRTCAHALGVVAEGDARWARRLREARFRCHNAHWLEVAAQPGDGGDAGADDGGEELFDRADLLSSGSGASDP